MKILLLIFVLLLGCDKTNNMFYYYNGESPSLPIVRKISNSTVDIYDYKNAGTGTILKKTKEHAYILTCAHVIANRKRKHTPIFDFKALGQYNITPKTTFLESIIKPLLVKQTKWVDGLPITYSHSADIFFLDRSVDICILRINGKIYGEEISPYNNSTVVPTGTEVYHVGNLFGSLNYSVTSGIISHNSRGLFGERIQVDIDVTFGSSGGGIFTKDKGEYVGMVTEKATRDSSIAIIIPIKKIIKWLEVYSVERNF